MIDRTTGEVRIPGLGVPLGPALSRDGFLALPPGADVRTWDANEPYHSFAVSVAAGPQADSAFVVVVQFYGRDLTSISLTATGPQFGTSWADWSEAKEKDRLRYHDEWLAHTCGLKPGNYPWGSLYSGMDLKAGSSSIVIRYGAEAGKRG
jgi:hypothetical protein